MAVFQESTVWLVLTTHRRGRWSPSTCHSQIFQRRVLQETNFMLRQIYQNVLWAHGSLELGV